MIQQKASRTTPLYGWHVRQGARMVSFGDYEMPLWYPEGAKQEHLSVITGAGLFDTSHMAAIIISGKNAFNLLQFCFTRDLNRCIGKNHSPLVPGKCVYGAFLNDRGASIDDAVLYQIEPDRYMIVVNSGMGGGIAGHLESFNKPRGADIVNLADKVGKIDIQGPLSARILLNVLKGAKNILKDMGYFSFRGGIDTTGGFGSEVMTLDNIPVLISRTGYTGEFGFELFTSPDTLFAVWETLLEAGKEMRLIPCGLAARDSLRAGALLPLSHQDIGSWPFINNPWVFALPFNKDKTGFTKIFIGDKALLSSQRAVNTYPFAGFDLRKVSVADPAVVLDDKSKPVGQVLTCVSDMAIGKHENRIFSIASPDRPADFEPKGLCCGFIKVNKKLAYGQTVTLKDNRRAIEVMITEDIRPDRTARRRMKEMLL